MHQREDERREMKEGGGKKEDGEAGRPAVNPSPLHSQVPVNSGAILAAPRLPAPTVSEKSAGPRHSTLDHRDKPVEGPPRSLLTLTSPAGGREKPPTCVPRG